jgi:hypothetical protein
MRISSPPARSARVSVFATFVMLAGLLGTALAADDSDLSGDLPPLRQNHRVLTDREIGGNVDSWFYSQLGGQSPQDSLAARLRKRVNQLARTTGLSKEQRAKLLLAGEWDIHHFVDRIVGIKEKYERLQTTDLDRLFQEVQPLLTAAREGIFDADSLFGKMLSKMLTPEQVASYERIERDRSLFQHRAGVRMTALRLSTALGLSDNQRQHLEDVLFQETRPTRITGPAFPAAYALAVYVQLNRVPEERLKFFLEPWQWEALKRKIAEREKYVAMLRSNGINPQQDQVPVPQAARIMKAH